MANFTQHFDQALDNIQHLLNLNETYPTQYKWQITAAHYAGLHLIHAFLADKLNAHPESHHDLKTYTVPNSIFTNGRLPADVYSDYELLEGLSWKARYGCEFAVTENHLIRAVKYLDPLVAFFERTYSKSKIPPINILCDDASLIVGLNHIRIVERVTVQTR